MTPVDAVVLLSLFVIIGLFVDYEAGAMQLRRWHTISFESKRHRWLRWGIALAAVVALVVFELWWRMHMGSAIQQ